MKNNIKERDENILKLRKKGLTLEEIGRKFNLTRERVRQIIESNGGPTSDESRKARLENIKKERSNKINKLVDEVKDSVLQLVDENISRSELEFLLRAFYPGIDAEVYEGALKKISPIFSRKISDQRFTDETLVNGYLLLHGISREISIPPAKAIIQIDYGQVLDIWEQLVNVNVSEQKIAKYLGIIAASKQEISLGNNRAISKEDYENQRKKFLEENGVTSKKGAFCWPATSQTLMMRFGENYWSDAVKALGLVPNERGRARGAIMYEDDAYRSALEQFIEERSKHGLNLSFEAFVEWVDLQHSMGHRYPSAVAVRMKYGTWSKCLRAVDSSPEERRKWSGAGAQNDATFTHYATLCREKITAGLANVDEAPANERSKIAFDFIKEIAGDFEVGYRQWFRETARVNSELLTQLPLSSNVKIGIKRKQMDDANLANTNAELIRLLPDREIDFTLSRRERPEQMEKFWFSPASYNYLSTVDHDVRLKYFALRALRNLRTHNSEDSLRNAIEAVRDVDDYSDTFSSATTYRVLGDRLVQKNFEVFRNLLTNLNNYWIHLDNAYKIAE